MGYSRATNIQIVLGSVYLSPDPASCVSQALLRTTDPDKDCKQ